MRWTRIADEHPTPHAKYLVRRGGTVYTAIPCYGTHKPWWVVQTMDREAEPVTMRDDDEWAPTAVFRPLKGNMPPSRVNVEVRTAYGAHFTATLVQVDNEFHWRRVTVSTETVPALDTDLWRDHEC